MAKNCLENCDLNEFKKRITSVEDFPLLIDYIKWLDKNDQWRVFSLLHLKRIVKFTERRNAYIKQLNIDTIIYKSDLQFNLNISFERTENLIKHLLTCKIIKDNGYYQILKLKELKEILSIFN